MIQDEREQIERIKYAAQRRIWVTFQKEGIHFYPAASTSGCGLMLYTMIETLNSSSSNDGYKNSTSQEPSNSTTSHVK